MSVSCILQGQDTESIKLENGKFIQNFEDITQDVQNTVGVAKHASTHAIGGNDLLSPNDIGAVEESEVGNLYLWEKSDNEGNIEYVTDSDVTAYPESGELNGYTYELKGKIGELGNSGDNFQVGDILTTVRTDLGDNWLYCNGDNYKIEDYQKLVNLLKNSQLLQYGDKYIEQPGFINWRTTLIYENNMWICAEGKAIDSELTPGIRIWYTSDLTNSTWYVKEIDCSSFTDLTFTSKGVFYPQQIIYGNGYWAISIRYYKDPDSTEYIGVLYSSDLLEDDWNFTAISSSSYGVFSRCLNYLNGYWIIGASRGTSSTSYGMIYYTTDITSTWKNEKLWSSSDIARVTSATFCNDYWIFCGISKTTVIISYTNDWKTFNTKNFSTTGTDSLPIIRTFSDGKVIVGMREYISSSKNAAIIWVNETFPETDWTQQTLWYSSIYGVTDIIYYDGLYWAGGNYNLTNSPVLACSSDLQNWILYHFKNTYSNPSVYHIIPYENSLIMTLSTTLTIPFGQLDMTLFQTPIISEDNNYVYIKGKE